MIHVQGADITKNKTSALQSESSKAPRQLLNLKILSQTRKETRRGKCPGRRILAFVNAAGPRRNDHFRGVASSSKSQQDAHNNHYLSTLSDVLYAFNLLLPDRLLGDSCNHKKINDCRVQS